MKRTFLTTCLAIALLVELFGVRGTYAVSALTPGLDQAPSGLFQETTEPGLTLEGSETPAADLQPTETPGSTALATSAADDISQVTPSPIADAPAVETGSPEPSSIPPETPVVTAAPTLIPPTIEATAELTPTETLEPPQELAPPAPQGSGNVYLPLIARSEPAGEIFVCQSPRARIPDNSPSGVISTIAIQDLRTVRDINVYLDIDHSFVSDLVVKLSHPETGQSFELLNRPGLDKTEHGCYTDNVSAILDDEMTLQANNQCYSSFDPKVNASFGRLTLPAISGMYLPKDKLSRFDGASVAGSWQLQVIDVSDYDTGSVENWCMEIKVGGQPEPAPAPAPALPSEARIWNITGQRQAMPLDCESRVAVDYARFFGKSIGEYEFFYNLPTSDDPDAGFVGDVWGQWGYTPPSGYGVHAEPVAALLRQYGVPAHANRPLRWDDLRTEVAAGRPVFVWTVSDGKTNGIPQYYQASNGHRSVVAAYQHVVMVIGYSPTTVTVLDGGTAKAINRSQFIQSWSALGNMAITAVDYP